VLYSRPCDRLDIRFLEVSAMATVLLVVHLMIAAALVGVVLIQRSEGGALGVGGGGGGFMSGRGQANFLTRLTAWLAAGFFLTSLGLTLLAQQQTRARSVFDAPAATAPATVPGADVSKAPIPGTEPAKGGLLDSLKSPSGASAPLPRVPQGQ
jgi:preprotein translocase subunit SecG